MPLQVDSFSVRPPSSYLQKEQRKKGGAYGNSQRYELAETSFVKKQKSSASARGLDDRKNKLLFQAFSRHAANKKTGGSYTEKSVELPSAFFDTFFF